MSIICLNRHQNQYYLLLVCTIGALLLVACIVPVCRADDYDDEGYGNQGAGNGNSGAGGSNQANDNDNYQNGYDDGYSGNMPNYQQNVDSDSSNSNPSSSSSNYSPQGGSDADGDYEGDDGSAAAAASSPEATIVRVRRSAEAGAAVGSGGDHQASGVSVASPNSKPASSGADIMGAGESAPKLRVKRHGKYYIGPVYTYVKTDKHANFKWGVSISPS